MTPTDPLHAQSAGPSLRNVITCLVRVDELSCGGRRIERKKDERTTGGCPLADIPRYTWLLSRYPSFLASFIRPFREVAVRRLCLEPGSRVLDVGCGTGSSFPFLVQAVGADGEVVGVEISPDLAAIARKRISRGNPWRLLEDRISRLLMAERIGRLLYLVWGCLG
jgi:SAM-dependent methyltransferase